MVTTIEMKMNYTAKCPIEGYVLAEASSKHIGRRTAVVGVDVFHINIDENHVISTKKLVGTAIATFQILRKSR